MNPALLVLDPQADFFGEDNPNLPAFQAAMPIINHALRAFHTHNSPVVVPLQTSIKKPAGSPQWQIQSGFDIAPTDKVMEKHYKNGFWKTDLEDFLHDHQIQRLVITGYISEHCVLSTYRGAEERGFEPALLAGGTAGFSDEYDSMVHALCQSLPLHSLLAWDFQV